MDMTKSLVESVTWLFADSPVDQPAIEKRARLLFLDTLGSMIVGLAQPARTALVAALTGLDPGWILLPGAAAPLTSGAVAYIAGLAACWDEACEGLPRAHGRPGLHAFAAALALGLARDHDLGRTLAALVAGYEVAGRLGEVLRIAPGMHVDGTWGTFGAIATVAGITAPPGAVEAFDRLALGGLPETKQLAPAGEWLIEQGYLKPFAAARRPRSRPNSASATVSPGRWYTAIWGPTPITSAA